MRNRIILAAVALVSVFAVIAFSFLKPTEEASAPIEAIPIELQATATSATIVEADPTPDPTPAEAPEPEPADTVTADPEPTEDSAPAMTETPVTEVPVAENAPAEASEPVIFEIVQESSQARYVIDEVLRGSPVTVVGATNQVAGQIAVDPANPAATQLGTIQVNARTFTTDQSQRDRAVQNRILNTDLFEYITFVPTALAGLPDSATPGESYSFQVSGDLTVRDQTRPATWDVTVTPVSESELRGSAVTTIAYADWGVAIPSVPFVAGVSDQVRLELDFVATP